jgi:hypothetical protein
MSSSLDRENFIPFTKAEIVRLCCEEGSLTSPQQEQFREFCRILESYYHFEYFELTERLKQSYYPFNPDKDTHTRRVYAPEELQRTEKELLSALREVLKGANYEDVSQEDLKKAMEEQSLFTINLEIDFGDFQQLLIFKRGERKKKETLKKWFGLKKLDFEMDVYERVVLYIQFKNAEYFKSKGKKKLVFEPGSTLLKLFKNIPKADIEMLFPNAQPQMSRLQKLTMGGIGIGAGIPLILLKVLPSIPAILGVFFTFLGYKSLDEGNLLKAAIQGLIGIGALGGFLFKQWTNYKNKKLQFAKTLTDNLYFRNLDNNAGVFFHLVDSAEEEECKEAILGYYFLMKSAQTSTEEQLDESIEQWFESRHQTALDFEVEDALAKLEKLKICHKNGTQWNALPLEEAKQRIDELWDNFFSYRS